MRGAAVSKFAEQHKLKRITIADLIKFALKEQIISKIRTEVAARSPDLVAAEGAPAGHTSPPVYFEAAAVITALVLGTDVAKDPAVLALRAEAFGPHGTHRIVEATVARTLSTGLERGYIGQRGQDEQNRRARKARLREALQNWENEGGAVAAASAPATPPVAGPAAPRIHA